MAKARSPQYPAIGLREAIEKVDRIYKKDYQSPIARAVAAEHMGYTGLNGKSLGVLSALNKFGLLSGRGDETRVSDLAVKIIAHEPGAPERVDALSEAASKPELFSELDNRFRGGKASDAALRSYLLTQRFIPSAADAAIRSYRETRQLVRDESGVHDPPGDENEDHAVTGGQQQGNDRGGLSLPLPQDPYTFGFTPSGGLKINAQLIDAAQIDQLIRALESLKLLFSPADSFKRPSDEGEEL